MSEDLEKWVDEESWRSFIWANEVFYGYVRDIKSKSPSAKQRLGNLAYRLGFGLWEWSRH